LFVFATQSNLTHLCESHKIYLDGTFNYCTIFLQLFTIHNIKNGHYIPLAFCLLPDKCTQTYRDLLLLIMTECSKLNLTFCPKHVVADFEKAIYNAVSAVWPQSQIVGCRFHLRQAWWRKIQALGLSKELIQLVNGFVLDLSTMQPTNESCIRLADYFVDVFISENAVFPPSIWAAATASS
jgi:hypothetical protein